MVQVVTNTSISLEHAIIIFSADSEIKNSSTIIYFIFKLQEKNENLLNFLTFVLIRKLLLEFEISKTDNAISNKLVNKNYAELRASNRPMTWWRKHLIIERG